MGPRLSFSLLITGLLLLWPFPSNGENTDYDPSVIVASVLVELTEAGANSLHLKWEDLQRYGLYPSADGPDPELHPLPLWKIDRPLADLMQDVKDVTSIDPSAIRDVFLHPISKEQHYSTFYAQEDDLELEGDAPFPGMIIHIGSTIRFDYHAKTHPGEFEINLLSTHRNQGPWWCAQYLPTDPWTAHRYQTRATLSGAHTAVIPIPTHLPYPTSLLSSSIGKIPLVREFLPAQHQTILLVSLLPDHTVNRDLLRD